VKTPLHPGLDAPQSPAVLTVAREAINPKGFKLERALNNFIGELADMSEKFELVEEKPFDFKDGAKGLTSLVRFEMGPGQVCTQRYVLRVDGDVASRFCISVDARRADKLKDLEEIIRSFRLLTDKT
jgi:hypothetical protein